MITVYTGSNDFMRRQALNKSISEFISTNSDLAVERIDASEIELGRLLEIASSIPFLSDKQMIIITNILNNKSLVQDIDKFIDSVSDVTEVIIDEPKFDKRSVIYKTLKNKTNFYEYGNLPEKNLSSWIVEEAQSRGGKLNKINADLIISRVGTNQMLLSNELDKLISFNPIISSDSIEKLVHPTPSSSIFELIDAAFSGNKKKALDLYDDQKRQNVEPLNILGMIGWQIHIIAIVKFNERLTNDEIATKSKINPFVVSKTRHITNKLSRSQVQNLIKDATYLDAKIKTENIDSDEAILHFLLKI